MGRPKLVVPAAFPPEEGFKECAGGWHASASSEDWLYKPAIGIYYHTPTETLWRRTSTQHRKTRYVRIDLRGIEGFKKATFGIADRASQMMRWACFHAWRAEVIKFEEMERDITAGCAEARMEPLRTSAPCTAGAAENPGGTSRSEGFSWLLRLFAWRSQPAQDAVGIEPQSLPEGVMLTSGFLVRHNMQPAISNTKASRQLVPYERGLDRQAISFVHREKEGGWRLHVRGRLSGIIDESLRLRVGEIVRFDGERLGRIDRAFPELDEYVVIADGELVSGTNKQVRYFRADELTAASAEQDNFAFAHLSSSAR